MDDVPVSRRPGAVAITYSPAGRPNKRYSPRSSVSVATVRSKVQTQRRTEIALDYRLHLREGRWRIYDLQIDGVSFVSTYRSQFDRIIQSESYAALLERMRKKSFEATVAERGGKKL